ncbi:putative phage-type endonuclease [Pseudomonas sp. BIGb0408]|uniref:Putative phage-type endonuclease n=1 Tax=Phytopseudomonas flavescens TaxID=29435 RepID=A0A7Y9XQJ0_9GAMM|nr:putative phage-type endonuclease [Pseudomonas sp. BIGb0408]NYH74626.1 putative phage-type endonuclease [Pseudomonas flavescens]
MLIGRFYFRKVIAMTATPLSSTSKPRPALRLISTKELPREDWLAVRKQGIGSSDAGAAVGLNPYKSQLELWMEKTGRDTTLPKADPHDEESPMYWGNVLEPVVAWHYSKRKKNKVRRINAVLQHPDPELPWMLANIDREVIGADDVQILECKTAGINGARLWKEGVPEYVQLQVMHQLAVTGKQAADVAVLLGGQMLEIHRIERDEQMIARLIELERKFWHYVETDTPPPADGSASAEIALRCLIRKTTARPSISVAVRVWLQPILSSRLFANPSARRKPAKPSSSRCCNRPWAMPPARSSATVLSAGRNPKTAACSMLKPC